MRGVEGGKPAEIGRQIVYRINGIRRADRDAGAAIDAVVGIDVELRRVGEIRFVLLRMNAIHRAGLHAQLVLRTGIGDDVGHMAVWAAIRLPRASSRKQEVKLYNMARLGGGIHPIAKRYTGQT